MLNIGNAGTYSLPTDSMGSPMSSNLTMFEDGHALGPWHSLHAGIMEKGQGRYSHWDGSIIFSSTDGTDPRTNGRTYSIKAPSRVKLRFSVPLTGIVALADLAFLILFQRDISHLLKLRGPLLLSILGAAVVMLAALSAFGFLGTIVVARDGPPKDAALALLALQHAALGCLTSVGIWAAGAGISRLVLRDVRASLAQILIPAFPVSLLVLAVLVAITLTAPWGRPIAIALWLACLIPLVNWRPPGQHVIGVLTAALGIIPFAIAFGIWLALLWHGPTATLSGSPSGDLTFYAGNIWSLASQAYPLIDLGYVNGGAVGYFNLLYPALGAAILHLPNFDPFLFLLASGGTSYVLLSAVMLHLYVADRKSRFILLPEFVILVLAILVAGRYPYWVAESIPVVFAPALTISIWWMAEKGQHKFGWSLLAMLSGLGGSLLSKIVSAAVLVPLASNGIWSRIHAVPFVVKVIALGVCGVFGIYSAAMLAHFIPLFAAAAEIGPESYRAPQWYFLSRDAGALLMVALAWLVADRPVALALSLGLTTFLIFSFLFQINFVCVCIVLGLILIAGSGQSAFVRVLSLLAFGLSLPALILGDPAGSSSGIVWVACLGGAVLSAILSAVGTTAIGPSTTFRKPAAVATAALMITGLGLVGVARGSIIADSGWSHGERLTPALREIWSVVRERTPRDALIFTDEVDEAINVLGGWNTYAYSGQRQLYLSSYFTNFSLRNDMQKVREILAINKSVLDGNRSPNSVPTQSRYSSFYAVVSASRAVPQKWKLIFGNRQYALYDID
jgi:hypothetical protein